MLKTFQPFLAVSILLSPVFVSAETHKETPSEEMLEFLMEFADADDETFDMMIKNGVRDNDQAEIEQILNQKKDTNNVFEQSGKDTHKRHIDKRTVKSEV